MPAEADQAPDLSGVFVSEGEIEGHPSLTILNFSPPAPPPIYSPLFPHPQDQSLAY